MLRKARAYPKLQSWLALLYQKALPFLLFVVPSIRIAFEMREFSGTDGWQRPTLYLAIVIWGLFAVSTLPYVEMIFRRKAKPDSPAHQPSAKRQAPDLPT